MTVIFTHQPMYLQTEAVKLTNQLTEDQLAILRHKRELEGKVRSMIREVLYYIIFILFLACVIYTNQDTRSYLQNTYILNTFQTGITKVHVC